MGGGLPEVVTDREIPPRVFIVEGQPMAYLREQTVERLG